MTAKMIFEMTRASVLALGIAILGLGCSDVDPNEAGATNRDAGIKSDQESDASTDRDDSEAGRDGGDASGQPRSKSDQAPDASTDQNGGDAGNKSEQEPDASTDRDGPVAGRDGGNGGEGDCKLAVVIGYPDQDGDGFGDEDAFPVEFCGAIPNDSFVDNKLDCDDLRKDVNPGEQEICNYSTDDNCNGVTDETGAVGSVAAYRRADIDEDNDHYYVLAGNKKSMECFPDGRESWISESEAKQHKTDCDDSDPTVNPGVRVETCDATEDNQWTDDVDRDCVDGPWPPGNVELVSASDPTEARTFCSVAQGREAGYFPEARHSISIEEAGLTGLAGGSGGRYFRLQCPVGDVVVGMNIRAGRTIDQVQAICSTPTLEVDWSKNPAVLRLRPDPGSHSTTVAVGGTNPPLVEELCPESAVLVGLGGIRKDDDKDELVRMGLRCAELLWIEDENPLIITEAQPLGMLFGRGAGENREDLSCGGPSMKGVVTGLIGRSGNLVDSIGLNCGTAELD